MTSSRPWWAEESISAVDDFLKGRTKPTVFEWGSGGSTNWLLRRCEKLYTVEHDPKWAAKVPKGATLFRRPLDDSYQDAIKATSVDGFDLVVVDGRRRVKCVKEAVRYVRKGGAILLDDSQRDRYRPAWDMLTYWKPITFRDQQRSTTLFVQGEL
jgi:hypothetical protein